MRARTRLHGILGLAIHGNTYKYKEYKQGIRTRPVTLCAVEDATHTAAGRKRREDQIAEYLQRLIDQKKDELQNPVVFVSTVAAKWLAYIHNTRKQQTHDEYQTAVRYYLNSVHDHPVSEISLDHWGRFQKGMEGLSPATIAKHQQAFRSFLKYVTVNHVNLKFDFGSARKISVPSKKIKDYSPDELKKIEDYVMDRKIQDHIRIHMMLSETGIRAGELLNLKLEHIDIPSRKIWIVSDDEWTPKTGVDDWVPMSEKLAAFLEGDNRNPGEVWFLDDGDGQWSYYHVGAIGNVIRRISRRLGITGRKPLHAFRASMAKRIYKRFGIIEAQRILRHSKPIMTWKYIDESNFDLHEVVNAVSI